MREIKVSNKKIVIIGGGGFIGHNLALALNEMGAKVDLIDSLQVNNLYSFGHTNKDMLNKDLYLKIIKKCLKGNVAWGCFLCQNHKDLQGNMCLLVVHIKLIRIS